MKLRQKYKNAKKAIERLYKMRPSYYPYLKREEGDIHKYTVEYHVPFCDDIPEEHIRKVMSQKFADAVMDNMQMEAFETHDYYGHLRMLLNSCVRSQIDIDDMTIIYRTYDPDGNDIFAGMCKYRDVELIPCDHNTYSLDDKIIDYQMYHNESENKWELAVWYKERIIE